MIRLGARRKAEDEGAVGWGECSPVAMQGGGQRAREMQELQDKVEEGAARERGREREVQELQAMLAAANSAWQDAQQEQEKERREWAETAERAREEAVREREAREALLGQNKELEDKIARLRSDMAVLEKQERQVEEQQRQLQSVEWNEVDALVKGLSVLDLTNSPVRRDLMLYLQDFASCPDSRSRPPRPPTTPMHASPLPHIGRSSS